LEFRDSIYKALDKYQNYNQKVKLMKKKSTFTLAKNGAVEVTNAFARLYPLLNYELDKIIRELPWGTESFKQDIEHMKEKWKKQEICEHEYGQPASTLEGYGRQCVKCHYIERLKNPVRL
jgi:hypothetical protein